MKECLVYIRIHLKHILDPANDFANKETPKGDRAKITQPYLLIFQHLLFAKMQHENLSLDEIKDYLGEHLEEIDRIRERLEMDTENRPLKLLGLNCTYDLMNQIYTLIFTVGMGVIQKAYTGSSS